MATSVSYKTVTIHKDLMGLKNGNAATEKSETVKAITKAANDATSNQKLLEDGIGELVAKSKVIRQSKEKIVTTLSRQSKEKKIPKDTMTGVKNAKLEIEVLAQQAEEIRAVCSRAVEDLLQGKWKEQVPDGIAVSGMVKAKENLDRTLKTASESIRKIRDDADSMDELVRQVKGILSDTDKAARAESEANDVVRQINEFCEELEKDLDKWLKSGVGIKDALSAALANAASAEETAAATAKSAAKKPKPSDSSIVKQVEKDLAGAKKDLVRAEGELKQLHKDLDESQTELAKYEKMQALLVKTLSINYPKVISVSRESEASVQSVKRKFVSVRKFEGECEKAANLLSTTIKSLQKTVSGLSNVVKVK
jgi:chromosome segregation ATPase